LVNEEFKQHKDTVARIQSETMQAKREAHDAKLLLEKQLTLQQQQQQQQQQRQQVVAGAVVIVILMVVMFSWH
jgi:hypothetical protein